MTKNTIDSNESSEKIIVKNNKNNLQSLLRESIKVSLRNGSGVVNPVLYDSIEYSKIFNVVYEKMRYLKNSSTEEYPDITDDDIAQINTDEIVKGIERYAQGLKDARRNFYLSVLRNFPNISEKVSNFSKGQLLEKIEDLDENDINRLYINKRSLQSSVSRYFGISREHLVFRDYNFIKVFGSVGLQQNAPDLYRKTENATIAYKNHGITPDIGLIRELVSFYGTSDVQKKKEICDFFHINISLPDAISAGLISEDSIAAIAEIEYKPVWNSIHQNTKDDLILSLKNNDSYTIYLADFDTDTLVRHFDSKKMKQLLATAISKNLEEGKSVLDVKSGFIRDIVPELDENGTPRIHNGFLKKIKESSQAKNGISKIKNLENLTVGSILIFQDEADRIQYFRLDATDVNIGEYDYGVTLSSITGKQTGTVGAVKSTESVHYDDFHNFLLQLESARVLTNQEFLDKKTIDNSEHLVGIDHINGEDKLLDISNSEDITTFAGFVREINLIDPVGEKIGLEEGVSFISKGTLDTGEEYEGVWNISKINDTHIYISNGRPDEEKASFEEFLAVARKQGFQRIAKLETQADFLSALRDGDYGIDTHAEFHGNELVIPDHGHHGSNDHGHGHDSGPKKYEFFRSKSGGHIRINGFADGLVSFGEYKSATALADVQKAGNAGKLTDKQKKGLYENQQMSYGAFLNYIKKNDLKATTDNILVPDATDTYHPHDPHLEGSLLSKMGSYWSIADVIKGFGNITHGIEHYFEKSSKLNASRFALSMGKKLGLPMDIMAQLQADEVSGVKEIIEKIQEKIKNLNGPKGREKALHIAHNKNARPEEVGAAILHMVKGYGSLYAEDIAYAQGSESFINGLLHSCGFHGQALTDMKKKAREKSKVLLGNEAGSDLSEEEMIWGFMKMMDGNHDKYPVAATLVKAMGGPSGFENAWRKDGFDGAYEKGVRQAGDLVNAEARVDHGLSALSTHEYHTAIGSMEQAAGKDPSPGIQTLPVVWALGGYSKYLSTKGNQKIKGYADGKGHSLHAYSFLRTRLDNELYKDVFIEALSVVAPSEVNNLKKWIKDLEYDGVDPKIMEKTKPAINGIAGIWRKYHNKGLHDMLQGKNMWLVENANNDEKPRIKEYLKLLSSVHQSNSGDKAHDPDNGWYMQHGYVGSPIISAVEVDGKILNSMERTLRKIQLNSHQLTFVDKNHKERYWDPIVKMVRNLNRSSQDEAMKKAQYLQYRRDILLRLNEAFSSRGEKVQDFKKQEFYTDLLDMGIDMSVIFESGGNINKKIERTEDNDYKAWKNNGYRGGSATGNEITTVRATIDSVISPRIDSGYQGSSNRSEPLQDPDFNTSDHHGGPIGDRDLGDGSGPD